MTRDDLLALLDARIATAVAEHDVADDADKPAIFGRMKSLETMREYASHLTDPDDVAAAVAQWGLD